MTSIVLRIARVSLRRLLIGVALVIAAAALASCSTTPAGNNTVRVSSHKTTPVTRAPERGGSVARPSANPSVAFAPPSPVRATATARKAAHLVVSKMLAGFIARNWGELYDLSAEPIRQSQSRQAFISSMQSQKTPDIVSATLSGSGSESTQSSLSYWTQAVHLEVRGRNGQAAPYHVTIELVMEKGRWWYLTSSKPSPGS